MHRAQEKASAQREGAHRRFQIGSFWAVATLW